jgi:hypothetical protein
MSYVDSQDIYAPTMLSGNLFGGPDAKYVFGGENCMEDQGAAYVANSKGEVWVHQVDSQTVGAGTKLNGSGLFGGSNDKYVVFENGATNDSILVINTLGEVWAHDLSASEHNAQSSCDVYDTIGAGHKLTGPTLFGGQNDKYVLSYASLLVVNAAGEVWTHGRSAHSVGIGVRLSGPGVFGTPNDSRYVLAYLTFDHLDRRRKPAKHGIH